MGRIYKLRFNGDEHEVELTNNIQTGTKRQYKVDGKDQKVEIRSVSGNVFEVRINRRWVKVRLDPSEEDQNRFSLEINDKPINVDLTDSLFAPKKQHPLPAAISMVKNLIRKSAGPEEKGAITAPMPGVILKLKVKLGDRVHTGGLLAILEAMKMENEIRSYQAGKIREIKIKEGDNVQSGQTIMIVY